MVPNASQISQFYHVQEHRIARDILISWKHVLYSYTILLKHAKEIIANEGSGAFGQRSKKKESESSLRHSSIIEGSGIGLRMRGEVGGNAATTPPGTRLLSGRNATAMIPESLGAAKPQRYQSQFFLLKLIFCRIFPSHNLMGWKRLAIQ